MRKFHRTIGIIAAIFLLSVASTGVLLQFEELFEDDQHDKPAIAVADGQTAAIEKPTAHVVEKEGDEEDSFLLRLHTGKVFGGVGVYLSILWGSALIVLTLTGSYLYFQIYRARARKSAGKSV